MAVVEEVVTEPNKILFCQGLPAQFPKMALQMLFQQCAAAHLPASRVLPPLGDAL